MKRMWLTFLLVAAMAPPVTAAEAVRVGVLPYTIHAQEGLRYLANQIPEAIARSLREKGASVETIDPAGLPEAFEAPGTEGLRRFGTDKQLDYLVWGSFSIVGKRYSLDTKMLACYETGPVRTYFVEGEGMQTLLLKVGDLSRDLEATIFRRERVAEVTVTGNRRIETDAIVRVMSTKPGTFFGAKDVSRDIEAIFRMGYFDDIRVEKTDAPKGKRLTFYVTEKPTVHTVTIQGNRVIEDEKIREALDVSRGSILNLFRIQESVARIEILYKEKNYHGVRVAHKILPRKDNEVDVDIVIEEGHKAQIRNIRFEGNRAFTDDRLKKIMKTREKGFFSWLTQSGNLDREDLRQDATRLMAFYHTHGYVQAKVAEPEARIDKDTIAVTVKIEEGPQFRVGKVDVTGDLIAPREQLLAKMQITGEKVFNREAVREDVLLLTDLYADAGYAYAEVIPLLDQDPKGLVVGVTYSIEKGSQVTFERIIIAGNTKTRDKVIRRELKVEEQRLYSGALLKRGVRNLHRLDFFEDIKVNTAKGSDDDKMILKIDVTEKPTGSFSFGGGYSSFDNGFLVGTIAQRNLFGRGQKLNLRAHLGGRNTRYSISFVEPWLFDIPLSAGIDVYDWNRDYDTYEKHSRGGRLKLGYPVFDYTSAYISYLYDTADIRNIDTDAARAIKELEGTNVTSSVAASLVYDSRDRLFNPTEGSKHSVEVEYAGDPLGGDIAFTKYVGDTGCYIPLLWGTTGFVHAAAGYVRENTGGILPIYERFYLGGINSVRGFRWNDLSPTDVDGAPIGGNKFIQFNLEYLIPVVKKAGVVGVLFFDTGNAYDNYETLDLGDMRESVGFGVRWYSPVGPIRLERGYIIDPQEGEDGNGRWEFTMGGAF